MSRPGRKRVAVLISGRGSNMEALARAAIDPEYPCEIAGVISNKAEVAGLRKAQSFGIATLTVANRDFAERADHEAAMLKAIDVLGAEIVCLAGYMRILSDTFVKKWHGRMINIHPSLLPAFRGVDTHARALASGLRIHGCTVHFVTPEMDDGPIIAQAAVPVLLDDDEARLAERVLAAEHRLYPMALAMVARGQVRVSNGRCVYSTPGGAGGGDEAIFSPPSAF